MSHQGDKDTGHGARSGRSGHSDASGRSGRPGQEDDWWGQLYDESKDDAGPAAAADTLDDRFASAADTVSAAEEGAHNTGAAQGGSGSPFVDGSSAEGGAQAGTGTGAAATTGREEIAGRVDAAPGQGDAAASAGRDTGEEQEDVVPGGRDTASAADAADRQREEDGADREPKEDGAGGGQGEEGAGEGRRNTVPGQRAPAPGSPAPSGRPAPQPPSAPAPPRPTADQPPPPPPPSSPSPPPTPTPAPPTTPAPPPPLSPSPPAPPSPDRSDPLAYRAPDPWAPSAGTGEPVTFPGARKSAAEGDGVAGEQAGRSAAAPAGDTATGVRSAAPAYVGEGPPTYEAEPTGLPAADPDALGELVADTVLDGARYGTSTLRAASVRGDSPRYRGEPRRDALLTARFGSGDEALVLVAVATGTRATAGAHRAAADACALIGRAVGRSHPRLAQDLRAAHRGELKSGLHRLTDRSLGKLRARAAELGVEPDEYTASLRCLLLPADPECRTRVFFGVGGGGLFRLRDGEWQDIEPRVADTTGEPVVGYGSPPADTPEGDRLTMDLGIPTPPSPYEPAPPAAAAGQGTHGRDPVRAPFRFRASVARPGDTLLLCSGGLAEPLRGEPELARYLTRRWAEGGPPGLAAFLADTQVRVRGYADDRTAAAVWEA